MPSLLNLLPNAVGQSGPQVIYAEVGIPAPTAFTDPLIVVIPDWTVDIPITIVDWPAAHGNTLPLTGDAATLVVDSRGVYRCVWWDGQMTYATQQSQAYYLTTTNSAVGGHKKMTSAPVAVETEVQANGLAAGTHRVVLDYVTDPGVPGVAYLPAGQFEFHIHALQRAGNQTVRIFAEFWEYDPTGGATIPPGNEPGHVAMIGVSQESKPLTGTETEYRLFFTTQNVYTFFSSQSRIAIHVHVDIGGVGATNISHFVGGDTDSHAVIPVGNPAVTGAAWIAPSLINSWANVATFETAGYLKDPLGFVHLKGTVGTGASGTVAFVLPAGYRPGGKVFNAGAGLGPVAAYVVIDTSGNVSPAFASGGDVGLSGITFLAEN